MVKLGVTGKVLSGKYAGSYILIEQKVEEFKGEKQEIYIMYQGDNVELKGAWDSWLPDYDSLIATMKSWEMTSIQWMDESH